MKSNGYSGARSLRNLLPQSGYKTNTGFAGVYSLAPEEPFRPLMQSWLKGLPDGGLIMCHPGLSGTGEAVDHATARHIELDYLSSDLFPQDCLDAKVQLQRLSQ